MSTRRNIVLLSVYFGLLGFAAVNVSYADIFVSLFGYDAGWVPEMPMHPWHPTSLAECDEYREAADLTTVAYGNAHARCLEEHNDEKTPVGQFTCSRLACQELHNRMLAAQKDTGYAECLSEVKEFQSRSSVSKAFSYVVDAPMKLIPRKRPAEPAPTEDMPAAPGAGDTARPLLQASDIVSAGKTIAESVKTAKDFAEFVQHPVETTAVYVYGKTTVGAVNALLGKPALPPDPRLEKVHNAVDQALGMTTSDNKFAQETSKSAVTGIFNINQRAMELLQLSLNPPPGGTRFVVFNFLPNDGVAEGDRGNPFSKHPSGGLR